jgi:amino-acid N-acetyltransferase
VGFDVVERGVLSLTWKDCLRCPKFHQCDEIAVLKILRPGRWSQAQPELRSSEADSYTQPQIPRRR